MEGVRVGGKGVLLAWKVAVARGGCVGAIADWVIWKMAVCAAEVPAADTGSVGVDAEAPGMLQASAEDRMAIIDNRTAILFRPEFDIIHPPCVGGSYYNSLFCRTNKCNLAQSNEIKGISRGLAGLPKTFSLTPNHKVCAIFILQEEL
jgi:hypothetical protein